MNRPIATNAKIRELRADGWKIEEVGNKMHWTSPAGETIISGKCIRDHRAVKNHAARLKRAAQPSARAYN